MKIRIRGNSIRLRLQRTEVSLFARTNRVEDKIQFGSNSEIVYSLNGSATAQDVDAALQSNEIRVTVPLKYGVKWATSDQVTMESSKALGGDSTLRIIVEKDFQCLSPRSEEDESDMYPNPNERCAPDYP